MTATIAEILDAACADARADGKLSPSLRAELAASFNEGDAQPGHDQVSNEKRHGGSLRPRQRAVK